jgi:hypothetical protein
MRARVAILLASASGLAACDPLYGVIRQASKLQTEPTPECVENIIRSAPGVLAVQHDQYAAAGRPITLSGLKPPSIAHRFSFTGSNQIVGSLEYEVDYKGQVSLSIENQRMAAPPPQEQITASRPVMRFIERSLEAKCGMTNLSVKIKESCRKVACPALP